MTQQPSLVLNHAFLEGMAFLGLEAAKAPVVELMQTALRTRRVRNASVLHVHPSLSETDVGGGLSFVRWANARMYTSDWADLLLPLLQLGSGPFVHDLERDNQSGPTTSIPECASAPDWLKETLFLSGHHVLSVPRQAWLLSYGENPYLTERRYRIQRGESSGYVENLRSDRMAAEAEATLAAGGQVNVQDILNAAERIASRVVVLESARHSAAQWTLDCRPERLMQSLTGLDVYAQALQNGKTREVAAEEYKHATSIEMSQEKSNTLKKPTLRAQRMFSLPDGRRELFDMHAKPGADTRIHVFSRAETRDINGAQEVQIIIYVGHCGKHLDLK